MSAAVPVRDDFSAEELRLLAGRVQDAPQACRLLAIAAVYDGMDREEAISFGRVFRQNTILYAQNGRPELIVTDPTADDIGHTFQGNWRVRT